MARLLSAWLETKLRSLYFQLGFVIGKKPLPFVITPILLTIISIGGLARLREEDRVWYLYSPQEAESHYEHAVAEEFFQHTGGKFWVEAPVSAKDWGSLLRPNYLEQVENLSNYLTNNITVPCHRGNCSFRDLCVGQCNDGRVLSIFTLLYRNVTHFRNHPNFRLTYPTMHLYNDEYYVGEHFAGVSIDPITNRINSMALVLLHFRTDMVNDTTEAALHQWELKLLNFVREFEHPLLNMSVSSNGLISYEVRRNGLTCIPYFWLSVIAVLFFASITTIKERNIIYKPLEAIAGVIGPLGAIGFTYGTLFFIGLPFSSITIIMPFLVLGIGVDDFFIILHAFRETNSQWPVEKRIAHSLSNAGPSITITSLTNFLSFAVGAFSTTPAIRLFCIFTAVGLTVDFFYQITFFVGALTLLSSPKVQKFSAHSCRALRPSKVEPEGTRTAETVSKSVDHSLISRIVYFYSSLVHVWPYKALIALILGLYWTVAGIGALNFRIDIDSSHLILKDSPLHNVVWAYRNYAWKQGNLIAVFVNKPPDFQNQTDSLRFLDMVKKFEHSPYAMGRNSTTLWVRSYMKHLLFDNANHGFYEKLHEFLNDKVEGVRWKEFIRFKDSSIENFFFTTGFAMGNDVSWKTRTLLQNNWRKLSAEYVDYNVTVFQTWSFFVDQFQSIGNTTLTSVIIALIVMALVCLFLIPNPLSVLAATFAMLSTNLGVVGFLNHWNVDLDPITMCTILMSIGFSVDFTVHISYHYYRFDSYSKSVTSQQRLAEALKSIAWPMVQAGLSTLLGVWPLCLVPSFMVTVFIKTVFLVVTIGLIHGLIVLPVLLTSLPNSWYCCTSTLDEEMPKKSYQIETKKASESVPSTLPGKRSLPFDQNEKAVILTRITRKSSL